MSNPKISVCISVHNTANYLPRCLDSILNQTFRDYEIVLVNNGSTDNSEDIMFAYQQNNPDRIIRIFSQEDKGLAQGRQTGINYAQGKYITFLDADDYLLPMAYEKINDAIEKSGADIIEIETLRGKQILSSPFSGLVDANSVLREYFLHANIPTMLWMRTYKRELFEKKVLPEIYINNEDNFAYPCLLFCAKSIFFIKEPLHVYSLDNEQGVMLKLNRDISQYKKLYKSKKEALRSVAHIQKYIGLDIVNQRFAKEFLVFTSIAAVNFLFLLPDRYALERKIKDAVEVLPVNSDVELLNIIRVNIPRTCFIYRLIRMIGIHKTYWIFALKERIKTKIKGGN